MRGPLVLDVRQRAPQHRRAQRPAWTGIVLAAAGCVAVVVLFAVAAKAVPADSDGASLVLEGQTVVHGHLLLQGWALSLDSFWTSEVPFYAAGNLAVGVSPALLTFIPALLYAIVVVLATAAGSVGFPRRAGLIGGAVTFALACFPTWALTIFVLRGGHHMGAMICSFAAFLLLARPRTRANLGLATAFLLIGMLGDLQTVAYGTLPVICVGVVQMLRRRRLRAGAALVGCGVGAGVLFVLLREATKAAGAFTAGKANALAHTATQLEANGRHLYSLGGELVGLKSTVFGTEGTPSWLQDPHVVGAVLIGACALAAFLRLVVGVIRPKAPESATETYGLMDDFLVFAALGATATYLLLAYINSTSFARYLAPTAVYLFVLTGRWVARAVASFGSAAIRRGMVAASLVLGALFAAGFAYRTSLPKLTQPGTALASWLGAHHLRSGVGAYWAASITTVASHDAVRVRPVVPDPSGRLVRYDRESDAGWYRGQKFDFLVFPPGPASAGVDATEAARTWGPPARAYFVDGYDVLVWSRSFRVPATGGYGS